MVPGANIGPRHAVFEAVHGSAPDIAGKGLANPIAVVRSAAMLLEHVGHRPAAERIERAVLKTLQAGAGLTPDLALQYQSSVGNGLLGVGWGLSGLSIITRCPQTWAQDVHELEPGGYLFIGHSESLTGAGHSLSFVRPAIYRMAGRPAGSNSPSGSCRTTTSRRPASTVSGATCSAGG